MRNKYLVQFTDVRGSTKKIRFRTLMAAKKYKKGFSTDFVARKLAHPRLRVIL